MSGGLPWFRAYSDMVDNEKLRLLAFEDRWHFVAILCCKSAGLLDKGDTRDMLWRKLAVKLGLQLRELEAVAARLADMGLIDGDSFQPLKWNSRQFISDSSTQRSRVCREKKRANTATSNEATPVQRCSNVAASPPDADTYTNSLSHSLTARANHEAEPTAEPTAAQLACTAMLAAAAEFDCAFAVNASHPKLLEALARGVTAEELADGVREVILRARQGAQTEVAGLSYVCATAIGRRQDVIAKSSECAAFNEIEFEEES